MITIEKARNGQSILKKNGRYLASSFDPGKEAIAWAEKFGQGCVASETLVVLGCGAGYHVKELMDRSPGSPIVVIEFDSEIASAAKAILPVLSEVSWIVESDWLRLVDHDVFKDLLATCFKIFSHGPSLQSEPEFFARVQKLLVARDKVSFLLQMKARPEIFKLLNTEALEKLGADEMISIKTLKQLFAANSSVSHERRIWKALEELIV